MKDQVTSIERPLRLVDGKFMRGDIEVKPEIGNPERIALLQKIERERTQREMAYRENFILRRVAELKGKRKMKTNRLINECHCYNCRKYEECQTKGVFDDDPGFDFCVNYEDVSYPDDDNDEND